MSVVGAQQLPPKQRRALRAAIRWECFTIGYTLMTIVLVAMVMGNSQSMKTAWIEDMLSLIPQISFLVAQVMVRRPSSRAFPFGYHRAMDIGHLVSGVALLAVGVNLAFDAASGLIGGERPSIGTMQLFGMTFWAGWAMVAVMAVVVIGPLIYGPAKLKLAPVLHNKILYADAQMARADWHTNAASIVGVLGVGIGLWWLDGAAALFISVGIVLDGVRSTRYALRDLLDERARTFDDAQTHPLVGEVLAAMRRQRWVQEVGVRMRDQGQIFHVEIFVVPRGRRSPRLDTLEEACREIAQLDWKLHDVSVIPVHRIPDGATR